MIALVTIFPHLSAWLTFGGLLIGTGLAAWGLWLKVFKPVRKWFTKWDNAMDTLGGYDPILDKTGTVLKPATPPLANRVERLEDAVITLTNTNERLSKIEDSIVQIERWQLQHDVWAQSELHMLNKRIDDIALATPPK